MWIAPISLIAAVSYGIATYALVALIGDASRRRFPAWPFALAALLLHAIALIGLHGAGLDMHFFAALSVVGFAMALGCVVLDLLRDVKPLGIVVYPLALILLLIDALLAPHTNPLPADWQIRLHVIVALLGYSVLSVAALLAIMLALQERGLRAHKVSAALRALPPLTMTETLLFQLILIGFVLLSMTLLTGILFVHDLFDQHLVHKTVLSIVAWMVFGALLFGRWRYGWRGRRAVHLTLTGMIVLLLAFFGSKFVLELVLHRVA